MLSPIWMQSIWNIFCKKIKRNVGIVNKNAKHITKGMFDWSDDEVTTFISDKMDEMGAKLPLLKGARYYIDRLRRDNHKIYLLTHRKNIYWKDPENITKQWLKNHKISYDKLIFTKTANKSAECRKNKIDIMFDDSVSNCKHLIQAGILTYLVKTRYNKNYKNGLAMADNWKDIYQIITEKSQKLKVILDTDTYNECDDQFALAYMLKSLDKFDIQAITIALFSHPEYGENIVGGLEKSYNEIVKICRWLNFDFNGKIFKGAENYLKDGLTNNAAANKIIETAMKNDKTYIMAIGAITNIAVAILKEPKIINRIEVIWLGGNGSCLGDNQEFNFEQDVEAVKTVFASKVRLTIIPAKGVASGLMTSIYELRHHLAKRNELCDYLCKIFCTDGYHKKYDRRVIWDISVIAYLINENWFETRKIHCPNINSNTSYNFKTKNHKIIMVDYINAKYVYRDLFAKLKNT